jgi:hypothetical protein
MLLHLYNSVLAFNDSLGKRHYLNIVVCLVYNHELRVYLEHDSRGLLENLITQIKVIILIVKHIKGKHLDINDAIFAHICLFILLNLSGIFRIMRLIYGWIIYLRCCDQFR